MTFEGRVVAITGATGGLGRVVAQAFAGQGATLALLSSDPAKLEALVAEQGWPRERVVTYAADLRDPIAVQAAAEALRSALGRIDILLHLVGGWLGGKELTATSADELRVMLEQHVWTTFHLLQAFVPHLAASGRGRVIVVSSPVASRPPAKQSAYAAAKAAEEALVLTLAQEAREKGVTANVLVVRSITVAAPREQPTTGVSGTPADDIAAAMLYLCSEAAGMVNGVRLSLTGSGQ